jgi:hypothetical protein
MMSNSHQLPPQYVERDLAEVQWDDGVGDPTTNYQFPVTPSREPQFVQKLEDFHQQGPGKYLRRQRALVHKNTAKMRGGFKKPYIATTHTRTR